MNMLFFFFCLPFLLLLVVVQTVALNATNKRRMFPLSLFGLAWRACLGAVVGTAAGLGTGYLVIFGPSHLTGGSIGLPWYAVIPALAVAVCVAVLASHLTGRALVLKARPRHLHRAAA